jgi:CBS domain-containing protein
MQCHEIMTSNVERVAPAQSVAEVARKMGEQMLGFLPVCDDDGRVLGVVTDRDIALRACGSGLDVNATRIDEVMSTPVIACRAYDPIARAERLICRHRKARLVVLDDAGVLVGVISLSDLAQHGEPIRLARVLRELSSRGFRYEGPGVRSVPPPPDTPRRSGQGR